MSLAYKIRLVPTASLSADIQKRAKDLAKARYTIAKLNQRLNPLFEQLKNIDIEMTKLSVQKAELEEEHPRLKDMYAKQKSILKELSASVRYSVVELLNEMANAVNDLRKIMFDADTLLYRENRMIDKLHKQIFKLKDKELSVKIMNQLNLIKEDIKTAARRLYESVDASELLKKPFAKRKEFPVSEEIARLSMEAVGLEKVLEKLKVTSIDEITKDAEKELADLEKIEIAVVSMFPEFKENLSHIISRLHLLDFSAAERIREKIAVFEAKMDRILERISAHAEELFEEIAILEKLK